MTDSWNSLEECNVVIVLIDAAKRITPVEQHMLEKVGATISLGSV